MFPSVEPAITKCIVALVYADATKKNMMCERVYIVRMWNTEFVALSGSYTMAGAQHSCNSACHHRIEGAAPFGHNSGLIVVGLGDSRILEPIRLIMVGLITGALLSTSRQQLKAESNDPRALDS